MSDLERVPDPIVLGAILHSELMAAVLKLARIEPQVAAKALESRASLLDSPVGGLTDTEFQVAARLLRAIAGGLLRHPDTPLTRQELELPLQQRIRGLAD